MKMTATYSPDDNKLRLYASARLDAETYARVKAAGFSWAPKQECFYAPMWTPGREDLLLELCGDIGDDDTSLVDRAEARAERFENYSVKREAEAAGARKAVAAICEHIPFGQPILVGHHSERRARKDAERIESGMRKAVKLFETAEYWQDRAEGALRHAKYKELPAVRARRIKGIESDLRKAEKETKEAEAFIAAWSLPNLSHAMALRIANTSHISACFPLADFRRDPPASQYEGQMGLWSALDGGVISAQQAADMAIRAHKRGNAKRARWIAHYQNRLTYERAMLAEAGGLAADRFGIVPGGRVLVGREWLTVLRVNRSMGKVSSVTTNARYCRIKEIAEVLDYQAPEEGAAVAVKAATKLPPLVNYPGEGFAHITKAEWEKVHADYKGTENVRATETVGAYRVRKAFGSALWGRNSPRWHERPRVFITDQKRVDPPAPAARPTVPAPVPVLPAAPAIERAPVSAAEAETAAIKASLRGGVQVAAAPQLFPTPQALADKVAALAAVQPGQEFLEPSAGMGALVDAVLRREPTARPYMVEVSATLQEHLARKYTAASASHCGNLLGGDFLAAVDRCDLGRFERIVMNPPFADGADIKHIKAAAGLLAPGGRLVAICANGPRQQRELMPIAEHWEALPAGSFAESGTMVNAALVVLSA